MTNVQIALQAASRIQPPINTTANVRAEQVLRVADLFLTWLEQGDLKATMRQAFLNDMALPQPRPENAEEIVHNED